MGLDTILRAGVAILNTATASMQNTVQHSAWTGQDDYGAPTFATAVPRKCILDNMTRRRHLPGGEEILQKAEMQFLYQITIDPKDRIVLPDGTTAPIMDISGPVDPVPGKPYTTTVILGNAL